MGCRVAFGRVGEIALHVDESEQESFKKRDELGRSRNLQRQSNVKEKMTERIIQRMRKHAERSSYTRAPFGRDTCLL